MTSLHGDESRGRQPIEISIDLAGRLFDAATVGMRDFVKPLLERSGVDEEAISRLELEGLCLRLFTARTAFIRGTDQDDQHKTEVLKFFDELVASHFEASPERARTYADRNEAYQLAVTPSGEFEEALGREFSRVCGWEGAQGISMGASQAIAMMVTAQEAVSDYSSNPLRALLAREPRMLKPPECL